MRHGGSSRLTLRYAGMTLRVIGVSSSIVLLALAVLAIRYGHVRFPYRDDDAAARQPRARGA